MEGAKDRGAMEFCREDITSFSYESCYDDLLRTHPLLMHVLVASMSKEDIHSIKVRITVKQYMLNNVLF